METEQEVKKVETAVEEEVVVDTPAKVETPVTEETSTASAPVVSDAEAKLAAEALGREEAVAVETSTVPVGVVHGLRVKGREKDQVIQAKDELIQHLQTELETRKAPPTEISPLEQHAIDNPGQEMSEVPVDVTLADRKWQAQQVEKQKTSGLQEQRKQASTVSLTKAQANLSDYDDVVAMGRRFLTDGNLLDIQNSPDPAMKLYNLCIDGTLKSGTQEAVTLRQHLQSKVAKPQSSPKKEEEKPKPNDEESQQPEPEEEMSPRLAQTYAMLDM